MPSLPDNLSELIGEDPLTRLELDWDLKTMRPELVRLGCMLQAAGVEDAGTILDTIQSDVQRLVMVRDDAQAHKAAGALVMASLNRALRKAKADCRFEPIDGEVAWTLQRIGGAQPHWPRWMLPQLIVAFLGLAAIVVVSWFLFVGGVYSWLLGYLGLTVGAAVVSTRTRASPSVPLRVGLSLVVVGTSAVGIVGLSRAGDSRLVFGFAAFFVVLHVASFGLNAWKRSTAEPTPAAEG